MFEVLAVAVFIYLMVKGIGLALRITWGAAKVIAGILMVLALPLLIVCVVFAGGLALMAPVLMIAIAVGIMKACL